MNKLFQKGCKIPGDRRQTDTNILCIIATSETYHIWMKKHWDLFDEWIPFIKYHVNSVHAYYTIAKFLINERNIKSFCINADALMIWATYSIVANQESMSCSICAAWTEDKLRLQGHGWESCGLCANLRLLVSVHWIFIWNIYTELINQYWNKITWYDDQMENNCWMHISPIACEPEGWCIQHVWPEQCTDWNRTLYNIYLLTTSQS